MPLLSLAVLILAKPPALQPYRNGRWDFKISSPQGWVPSRPPENGSGQAWVSKDRKSDFVCYASFNSSEQTLAEMVAEQDASIRRTKGKVLYRRVAKTWYVLNWVVAGKETYERVDWTNDVVSGWVLTYPASRSKSLGPLIEAIAKTWRPATKELG